MSSDWDMPEARYELKPNGAQGLTGRAARHDRRRDGMIDPVSFFGFILRNIFKIGLIAAVLTVICVVLFNMAPFPYKATATVMVDPRDQRVTLQEDVLSSIGSDAAVLESMVQIMKSDGFLLTVMDQLNLNGDTASKPAEANKLEELAKFKKNLLVERKGATYLVEISYKADTAQDAARIANSVADAFAATQNGYLSDATQNAARALSERLVELRRKLDASEKAVADFAAEHDILYVDSNNTLEMRQLTELSAQLAVAKNATEEARARYRQQLDGGSDVVISSERNGEPAQLAYLRQQRTQLVQTLEQQSLTFGPRHPRIAQTRQAIEGIERQIRDEKQLLTQQLKGALDVAEARQKKLEADIAKLSSGVVMTDAAEVRLEALRREAAADRDIYEKFLSRNKATDELAELKSENVKVVSPAVPPLKSSRPPIMLVVPILGFLGAVAATALLVVANNAGLGDARPTARPSAETTVDDAPAYPAVSGMIQSQPQPPAIEGPPAADYQRANTSLLMLGERPTPQMPKALEPQLEIRAKDSVDEDEWRDLEAAAAPMPKSLLMMGRQPA